MDFKSKCTDSSAIMKMLDRSKVGEFEIHLLKLMSSELTNISETQGFPIAILYAYQLGHISGINEERERRKKAELKKMFSALNPECQELVLDLTRSLVKANEANQEPAYAMAE